MEEPRQRLEEEHDKQNDADDCVVIAEIALFRGDVHAQAETCDEDGITERLKGGMDPDKTCEVGDADDYTAGGEEGYEGKGGEHAMCQLSSIA